ncbi:MAG: hypothetical protein H0T89_17070 [Deltaproteobacteria bacterium]|nr:hypothetical protein [Deltaproteobacteria bacterium]MDQ3294983.1 hypothetical protein [Myxococcota bacterium]
METHWVGDGGNDVNQLLGLRVFSATLARRRSELGDGITSWIRANPDLELVDKIVLQSSDAEFHCLSIVVFFRYRAAV